MSKKRTKSGAGSAGIQRWETALLTAPFCEEDKWNASVAFVIGHQAEDYEHLSHLVAAINAGTRRLFSIFTKDELYEMVNDLGNPKAKKAKEIPQFSEICEPCKMHLDNGEDIPMPLLAKLIKFRLLDIKQKDLKRRETEKRGKKPKIGGDKDKGGKKADKGKERTKSPGKGKGGKKTPDPPSARGDTKLKKRGEEDIDNKYIDDEPDDGPQHYIMICGFHQPRLLSHLADLSICVDSIIRFKSEDYARFIPDPTDEDLEMDKDEKMLALEEVRSQVKEKLSKEIAQFWKDILLIMRAASPASPLHDVAQLEYIVKESIIPPNMEDNGLKTQFGVDMYEDIACMMYDLMDAKRQWRNYLESLHLLPVPEYGLPPPSPDTKDGTSQPAVTPAPTMMTGKADNSSQPGDSCEPKLSHEVDMRFYQDLMNTVPQESSSIPLIMHCMLEQVVATEEDREPPSETPHPTRADGLDDTVASHISSMAFKLALSEDEQQALSQQLDTVSCPAPLMKQPLLLSYHDDITRRLNHLKPVDDFDAMKAELSMLGFLPMADLAKFKQPSEQLAKERAASLQELLHFCITGGLTQLEIEHAMCQFVLECVELSETNEDSIVCQRPRDFPQYNIPWDHPFPFFQGMILACDEDAIPLDESSSSTRKSRPGSARTNHNQRQRTSSASSSSPLSTSPRPQSPGILKSSRTPSATSRKPNDDDDVHSVHFERDGEGNEVVQPGDDKTPADTPSNYDHGSGSVPTNTDPMSVVNDKAQKRVLDQWCFAEHHKPKILLQVMNQALSTHPYMDTYYHRRDNSLLVVLHNPHSSELQSFTKWEHSLHSNVGFRNYMDHVAGSIEEWTRAEESKYQAAMLAKEVDQIMNDAEEASSPPTSGKGGKKKERSKSPKKSTSRAKSSSRSSSVERPTSGNMYIRQGSLKAWKEDQDKVRAEEDEKERQKQEKRAKSAEKRKSAKDIGDDDKESKKRPGSRQSSKSRQSKEDIVQDQTLSDEVAPDEPFWPFIGYDVGNNLIHASGSLTTLFPADGGQIKTEKTEFIQGTLSVKTNVLKDGHVFTVHILDPKKGGEDEEAKEEEEEAMEKGELETQEKDESDKNGERKVVAEKQEEKKAEKPCVGHFGSFSALFSDGLNVSLSTYGASGMPINGSKYEPVPYIAPAVRSPSPQGKDGSPTKHKRDKSKDKAATPDPSAQRESELLAKEEEVEAPSEPEPVPHQPFQQLFLSCPDGLNLTYFLESSLGIHPKSEDSRHLLVRQSYPYKTKGIQACEGARKNAMTEVSRIINADGTVTKTNTDGTITVMFADGAVSHYCTSSALLPGSRNASPTRVGSAKSDRETPTRKKGSRRSGKKEVVLEQPVEEDRADKAFWITTLPSGERVASQGRTYSKVPVKMAKICVATDPQTGQTMHTRDDHVVTIYMPDGSMVVEHADGTRINTLQHQLELKVEAEGETGEDGETRVKNLKLISVECPGYATVKFDSDAGHCSTELGNGDCVYTSLDGTYDLHHHDGGCLHMETDGTSVYFPMPANEVDMPNPTQQLQYIMRHSSDVICETVDNMGNTFTVSNAGEGSVVLAQGQDSVAMETEGGESDLIQKQVVTYKQHAPHFFIIHKDGSGTELLRYQDVASYVSDAESDPSTAILMDPLPDHMGVIGITVLKPYMNGISESWLKNYEMDTIIPAGLISRDFKSVPPKEVVKPGPKFGTNVGQGLAIGSAMKGQPVLPMLKCPSVLQLRQILQYKPVTSELRTKLGTSLKMYAEFVKKRLEQQELLQVIDPRSDEERSAAEQLQGQVLVPGLAQGDVKGLYEKVTAPPVPSPPPNPQAKRSSADWEQDKRILAEEKECKRALKQHDVPKYFDSEIGKSFLLSQAPDMESLTKQLADDTRRGRNPVISQTSSESSPQISPDQQRLPSGAASEGGTPCKEQPSSPIRGISGNTPSALRPGNPTPAHATGDGSPALVRPNNPTPAHASKAIPDRPIAPSPKDATNGYSGFTSETPLSHAYPSIPEQPLEEAYQQELPPEEPHATSTCVISTNSGPSDVFGESQKSGTLLPGYMRAERPGAVPNDKYIEVEDPVRRKVNTISLTGATPHGKHLLKHMRGCHLLPEAINFGWLKEGNTYAMSVLLKNTGVDTCRFKVKQPPPSTGLNVIYKLGPIAAGLNRELIVEIYAIAAGVRGSEGIGNISHNLEITTEMHHMSLPISATVLTAEEFDRGGHKLQQPASGVKLVSSRPPAGQGIIRPRKEE